MVLPSNNDSETYLLFGLLKLHAALAFSRLTRSNIACAGTAAITEMNPGTFKVDSLDRHTASAFGGIFGVDCAFASFTALAEKGLVPFNLDDMPPFEWSTTGTFPRAGADGVAFALGAAATRVKHILAVIFRLFRCFHGRTAGNKPGNQNKQDTFNKSHIPSPLFMITG